MRGVDLVTEFKGEGEEAGGGLGGVSLVPLLIQPIHVGVGERDWNAVPFL